MRVPLIAILGVCALRPAEAHEGLHERILAATRRIEETPCAAALYLDRADLLREHAETELAWRDVERAARLDADLPGLELTRALLLEEAGRGAEALTSLDRFLAQRPDDLVALRARARVHESLGAWRAAACDWDAVLAREDVPNPDTLAARARCHVRRDCGDVETALAGLQAGLDVLGPCRSLELLALDLETGARRFDAARARLERLVRETPADLSLRARLGDVLADAGRDVEARAVYGEALERLANLRPARRRARAVQDVEEHIGRALYELARRSNEEGPRR